MKKKIALIFGITGQDGSYLAEFLLKKNYIIHGVKRRSSSENTQRIDHLFDSINFTNKNFFLHYGDLSDSTSVLKIINKVKPSEIYNLAAQSHVRISFDVPEYTADITGLGTLRILESLRALRMKKVKFYQASSSEMFGKLKNKKSINELTTFHPRSMYGVSKVFSFHTTVHYREAYGLFACNGILFNHESPRRGETFVTRKITRGLCRINAGIDNCLYLGNLDAKRDWGHAKDYVVAMWKMLQNKVPDDFVICTGKQYTIKKFINLVAKKLKIKIKWRGRGINEKAYDQNNNCIIECHQRYFRPAEVDTLQGDYSKAKKVLKWKPKKNLEDLINDMISFELKQISK